MPIHNEIKNFFHRISPAGFTDIENHPRMGTCLSYTCKDIHAHRLAIAILKATTGDGYSQEPNIFNQQYSVSG